MRLWIGEHKTFFRASLQFITFSWWTTASRKEWRVYLYTKQRDTCRRAIAISGIASCTVQQIINRCIMHVMAIFTACHQPAQPLFSQRLLLLFSSCACYLDNLKNGFFSEGSIMRKLPYFCQPTQYQFFSGLKTINHFESKIPLVIFWASTQTK